MESGYNHRYVYDTLKERGYDVTVAHQYMVKVIAYGRVKMNKVNARMIAHLLRTDMIHTDSVLY
ncbi:MAG: hypothetical protein JRN32_00985 [Nitrososphaerota archaeon]|jgi:hypothetical protein|nr:hypothetical protein [Nitrososphaerota archaeon]MDG7045377.1 hypothetical protein [Nitrososphaerota archaeon]